MKNLKTVLIGMLLLAPMLLLAQSEDAPTSTTIVEWLSPFIVLGVTYLFRLVAPLIPGWATMLIVTGLSTLLAWVNGIDTEGMSFFMQVIYGMSAIIINQFYRAFTGGNATHARAKK